MSVIHDKSHPVVPPELETQSVPPTQIGIDDVYEAVVRPIAKVEAGRMFTFEIFVSHGQALRLWETELHLKTKITLKKKDNSALTDLDYAHAGIVNNFAHSIFNHITMEINGKPVTSMPTTYPYRAYMDTLFGFTNESKLSWLSSSGWGEDKLEDMPTGVSTNRRKFLNKEIDLIMRPHLDLLMQNKCLHGGINLRLNFYPQNEQFFLKKDSEDYKIGFELLDAQLRLQFNKLSETFLKRFRHVNQPDRYVIRRVEVKEHNIPPDAQNHIIDHLTIGQLPNVMIIGFVENEAFTGSTKLNPFNFQHHNITNVALYKNGVMVTNEEYKPDFTENQVKCLREYDDFFKTVNHCFTDANFPISIEKYITGNTFFAFNLNKDKQPLYSPASFINLIEKAETRLDIRFKSSRVKPLTCLVYSEYLNVIEIHPDGTVVTNYM